MLRIEVAGDRPHQVVQQGARPTAPRVLPETVLERLIAEGGRDRHGPGLSFRSWQVDYGQRGRVLLTTLTREFFMPRFLERDEGERAAPSETFPWDGVSNLRLLSSLQATVAVGVY